MKKPRTAEVVLSESASKSLQMLESSTEKELKAVLKSFWRKVSLLKGSPQYGKPIKKELIPKHYVRKYSVTNLWKVNLAGHWRMIYTLVSNGSKIIVFVIDVVDHKTYDTIFGYN